MLNNMLNMALEILAELFNNNNNNTIDENETYKYWMNLDYNEQEFYFNNNEYLKDYIKNDYYPNDRKLTAKHVAEIADKLNRTFTNKYDRY